MKFSTIKEVKLEDDNNFSVILQLENTTNDTINALLDLKIPSSIRSYSQDNLQLKINPKNKAFIPMQFTVNKSQMAGKLDLEFSLIDFLSKKEIGKSITSVIVLQKRNIKIFPVQSTIFYRQEGDSIHYELKVMNMGNQAEEVLLTNVLPDFRGNFISDNKRIKIDAFQEKTVRFSKYVDRDMMKIEGFQANVSGYTNTKDFAGNVFFMIQNASSNRVYTDPTMLNQNWTNFSTNYVRLSARDINSTNANYNLMAHQEFSVGLNEFAYNINGTSWQNDQDMVLTDSWIKYQRKNKGILIGSINNNDFDIPINGRGLMLFNNYDKNNNRIVVGTVEKNYNLLDDLNNDIFKNSHTTFANSRFLIKDKNELETTALFDRNYSTTNFVLTNGYKWITPNKWTHSVKFGYGLSKFKETNDIENSLSVSANVSGTIGKFDFYSSNYYSSGYYPGTRRGALYLNQRLQRTFSKFSMWSSLTITNNNPKSIDPYLINYLQANESKALRFETGISFKLAHHFNLSISPKFNIEKSNILNYEKFTYSPMHFKSIYLNGSFTWLSNSRVHQLVFNTLGGFSELNDLNKIDPIVYGQFTWNVKNFQLNTIYQRGSMMIAEVYSTYNLNHQLERFTTSASFRQSFFQKKLNTSVSTYYNIDKNFGNTITFGANVDYHPIDNFILSAQANLSHYDSKILYSKQTYLQVGVQYNLPAKSAVTDVKNGTLNLFVFYDYNANGIFDEGDKVADSRNVKINDTNFITDLNGNIKYRKVPYGSYLIKFPGQKWFAQDYIININEKTTTISIPMQQTGVVRGKVEYELSSKLEYQVSANLFGFTLIFNHENGQIFTVKTNDRGEYTAFLPVGNYTFYLLENSLPEHVYAKKHLNKVTVEKEQNIEYEPLILKIKERKVNIKRFGS
ncbi:hypothetical protein [Empedobacter brevis]|uniref:hypothetical protein n=1 Tax=Empedobacter brevis TaxID=247 RepID=UPI0039B0CD52